MNSKMFLVVFLLMAAAVECFARPDNEDAHDDHSYSHEDLEKYLTALEKIDLDQIMNNTRLFTNYMKCLMNEGPCTPQTKDIKKKLPLIMKDGCSSCTKEQKLIVKNAMDKIKENKPKEFEKLSKYFDPEGSLEKKFLENLNKSD